MTTTLDYLRAVEARHGTSGNKETGELLQVTEMSCWRYRTGAKSMGEEVARRVAHLLDLDEHVVLAELKAEQSQGAIKGVWTAIAQRLAAAGQGIKVAAVAAIALGLALPASEIQTAPSPSHRTGNSLYIM